MIKFVKNTKSSKYFSCKDCCYQGKQECPEAPCGGGVFIDDKRKMNKPSAPKRKSRDRRLLEALLNDANICKEIILSKQITYSQHCHLLNIKRSKEQKGGVK